MLEPKKEDPKETGEQKPRHLHKSFSAIFGKPAIFKIKAEAHPGKVVNSPNSGNSLGRKGLIFRLLSIVGLVLVLFFYSKSQREISRRLEMEGKLIQVTTEAKALQASLENSLENIKESTRESEELKTKLEQLSQEKLKLEDTLQEKEKKITGLSHQSEALTKTKMDLENRLSRYQQLSRPRTEKYAEETISEETFRKSGKVLVVRPRSSIAAINLGRKDGIEVGSIFDIYTLGNNYVAKLVIDEVENTVSVGKISPETAAAKVRKNYIVRSR